jgi:response regulator RpfG family c-di-GMP phosphodiesterase
VSAARDRLPACAPHLDRWWRKADGPGRIERPGGPDLGPDYFVLVAPVVWFYVLQAGVEPLLAERAAMLTETQKMEMLSRLVMQLNRVSDLDILMEHILTQARRIVNADAGSIYIAEDRVLHFTYTQNDTLQRRLANGEKLIYTTFSLPINHKSIAGHVADTGKPLRIADVYAIEDTAPYSFSQSFDAASRYATRSMLTLPLKSATGALLGILQIINAQDDQKNVVPFSENDEKMMLQFASIAAVALERAQMMRAIILRMIRMAELRDPKETGAHVNRVGGFAVEIYEKWAAPRQLPPREIEKNRDLLRMAAMLHDVGKVAISDVILKKPGRFNSDEYEIMKRHTVLGAQLFMDRQSEFDAAALQVALSHHEKWDGSGYPGHIDLASGLPLSGHTDAAGRPLGKKGPEIPLFGRIVALADVYDALSSQRTYKDAWAESDVLATLEHGSGVDFDPELVDIFFSIIDIIRAVQSRYADDA